MHLIYQYTERLGRVETYDVIGVALDETQASNFVAAAALITKERLGREIGFPRLKYKAVPIGTLDAFLVVMRQQTEAARAKLVCKQCGTQGFDRLRRLRPCLHVVCDCCPPACLECAAKAAKP